MLHLRGESGGQAANDVRLHSSLAEEDAQVERPALDSDEPQVAVRHLGTDAQQMPLSLAVVRASDLQNAVR